MAGGVKVWRLDLSSTGSVTVDLHRTMSLDDLIWLQWWQAPVSSKANKRRAPLILLTGCEDGLVSASLVTSAVDSTNEPPPKYLMGK